MSAEPGRTSGHEVVRPFVMTGGRTRADRRDLRVETMLTAVPARTLSPAAGLCEEIPPSGTSESGS